MEPSLKRKLEQLDELSITVIKKQKKSNSENQDPNSRTCSNGEANVNVDKPLDLSVSGKSRDEETNLSKVRAKLMKISNNKSTLTGRSGPTSLQEKKVQATGMENTNQGKEEGKPTLLGPNDHQNLMDMIATYAQLLNAKNNGETTSTPKNIQWLANILGNSSATNAKSTCTKKVNCEQSKKSESEKEKTRIMLERSEKKRRETTFERIMLMNEAIQEWNDFYGTNYSIPLI